MSEVRRRGVRKERVGKVQMAGEDGVATGSDTGFETAAATTRFTFTLVSLFGFCISSCSISISIVYIL